MPLSLRPQAATPSGPSSRTLTPTHYSGGKGTDLAHYRVPKELTILIERIHAEGVSVLLVEQNVALALDVATRAYVLEEGCIVAEDAPAALRAQPHIRRVYLGLGVT